MSDFQKNINSEALKYISTLKCLKMDKKNYEQYLKEVGHDKYFGIGREVPVVLDSVNGIEYIRS